MKWDPAAEFGLELKFGVFFWQVIKAQAVEVFFQNEEWHSFFQH